MLLAYLLVFKPPSYYLSLFLSRNRLPTLHARFSLPVTIMHTRSSRRVMGLGPETPPKPPTPPAPAQSDVIYNGERVPRC